MVVGGSWAAWLSWGGHRRRFAGLQLPLDPVVVFDGGGWLLFCSAGTFSGVGGWLADGGLEICREAWRLLLRVLRMCWLKIRPSPVRWGGTGPGSGEDGAWGWSPVDGSSSALNPARWSWWLLRPVNALVLGVLPSPWSGVATAGSRGVFVGGAPAWFVPCWWLLVCCSCSSSFFLFASSVLVFDHVLFPFEYEYKL